MGPLVKLMPSSQFENGLNLAGVYLCLIIRQLLEIQSVCTNVKKCYVGYPESSYSMYYLPDKFVSAGYIALEGASMP
ncbi:unnamed protein product [Calypogeia fissa]